MASILFQYISDQMKALDWTVDVVSHTQDTVLGKKVSFHNVVATLNPTAPRRLVLACHYDSLNKPSKGVLYRVAQHLEDPLYILLPLEWDVPVNQPGSRAWALGNYSHSPPVGGIFHKCLNKSYTLRCSCHSTCTGVELFLGSNVLCALF